MKHNTGYGACVQEKAGAHARCWWMFKDFFPKKRKYATLPQEARQRPAEVKKEIPEGLMVKCDVCGTIMYAKELANNLKVCKGCDFHFPMSAPERLDLILDKGSFEEWDTELRSADPLGFPGYKEKLAQMMEKTGLAEAVVTGKGRIGGCPVAIGVMDSRFIMGSMGSVVGEKVTRAIERAHQQRLPLILFSASGGARMQEGIFSLMQMAKTSAALAHFQKAGGLFISVFTNPTTGGVSASFSSLGDINLAEPGALIGFAGRRIIEQTIRQKLPDDFQTAEFLLAHGQLDAVVHRKHLRDMLINLLDLHQVHGACSDNHAEQAVTKEASHA